MARNPKLSVCIGTPEAPFVPRWTFWTQKNDTYLTTYAMGGIYKLSLHASGVWAGAHTTESGVLVNGNRRTHRWERPDEFEPGFVRGPEICIPRLDSRHDLPFQAHPFGKHSVWLPTPEIRHSIHLMTFFETDPAQTLILPEESEVLGALPLSNGESFWVIAGEAPLDREGRRNVRILRDVETAESFGVDGPIRPGSVAAAIIRVGSSVGGWPYITHTPLGSHNMYRTDGPMRRA